MEKSSAVSPFFVSFGRIPESTERKVSSKRGRKEKRKRTIRCETVVHNVREELLDLVDSEFHPLVRHR
jgi:hypothetical protein